MSLTRSPAYPLRFGVLAPDGPMPDWQATCLWTLLNLPGVELALWIDEHQYDGQRRRASIAPRAALFHSYRKLFGLPRSLRPASVETLRAGVPCTNFAANPQGRPASAPEDASRIRQLALDFILDFGTAPREAWVLHAARYGLWRFAAGTPDGTGDDMAAFWAIYGRERVTAGHLIRLEDDGTTSIILRSGYLKTVDHSYSGNVDSLLYEMAAWPAYVCRGLQDCSDPAQPGSRLPLPSGSHRPPSNGQMLRFLGILASNGIARAITLLFRFSAWNIGVVRAPIHTFLDDKTAPSIGWLPEPGDSTFRADPFALEGPEGSYLFFEEYDYHSTSATSVNSRGVISCGRLVGTHLADLERGILELPSHMSYPYLFHHAGNVYCIPETSEAREAALYRATRFPHTWEKVCTLLDDVAALDSTVFEWNGRWWLTCTDGDRRSLEALLVYHSPELFGPWTPHPRNPVKLDVRSARPAGTPFVHGGALYRPAQDCSGRYGGSVTLNRVIDLTPESFREETVATVAPDPHGPYRHGIHTLSAAGDVTLVDGRRLIFARTAFTHRLKKLSHLASARVRPSPNRLRAGASHATEATG